MRFLLFAPREGARFAGGLARCGCGLPCLGFCEFRVQSRTFNPGCTGQIGKFGSNPESRVFSIVYSDDTYFFESSLPHTREEELPGLAQLCGQMV